MEDDGKLEALRSGWSACRGSPVPSSVSSAASNKKNRPSWCLVSFQMATVLPLIMRTTCITDSFRKRPCVMYQDNTVGNVLAELARDCGATAQLIQCPFRFLFRRLKARLDALLNRLQGHGRQPIAKSGKFVRRAYSQTALDSERTTVFCFIPSWSTLLFERGLHFGGRGEFWRGSSQWNTKALLPKQQQQ